MIRLRIRCLQARCAVERCGRVAAGSPHRIFGSVLAVASAVLAIGSYHVSATTPRHHATTRYSVQDHVRALVVTAHVANVQVTAGATGAASVIQRLAFHGSKPATGHRFAAGTLALTSRCRIDEVCSLSYVITVPKSTAVRITVGLGTVRLSGLTGTVMVTDDAGQIDLTSISGPLHAATRAGAIIGQHLASPRASLSVSTGEIDASFASPPAAVTVTTDVGAIILRVPGNVSYDVTTSAALGHIDVTVTQDTAAPRTISASTKVGSITIEP
jgi:hypothetical protein